MLVRLSVIIVGALIGCFFVYFEKGSFPIEVILGFVIGGGILFIYVLFKNKKKKQKTPEIDERVVNNVKHFLIYAFIIAASILVILVLSFDVLGFKGVPLSYLYSFLFLLFLTLGLGSSLIKKR